MRGVNYDDLLAMVHKLGKESMFRYSDSDIDLMIARFRLRLAH